VDSWVRYIQRVTRLLAAVLLCAALVAAPLLAAPAPAHAAGDFATAATSTEAVATSTVEFWLVDEPVDVVSYGWQFRPAGGSEWYDLSHPMNFYILPVTGYSGGDYRGYVVGSDDVVTYATPVTLTVTSLSWSPAPMYVPEGVVVTQAATLTGADAALVRWQTADSPFGPWTDVPGATGTALSLVATLDLSGLFLRPAATVSGVELAGTAARLFVLPAAPGLASQDEAEATAADPSLTLIQGVALEGDELVVQVPQGDAFSGNTWYHATAYSTPTSLGWARLMGGELRFDVSELPAGEHLLLLRLPWLSGTTLALSDAVAFTIPAATQPTAGGDGDPELAATGVDVAPAAAALALLAAGGLLMSRARRRVIPPLR